MCPGGLSPPPPPLTRTLPEQTCMCVCDKSMHELSVRLDRVSGVPQGGGDRLGCGWLCGWRRGKNWGEGGESDCEGWSKGKGRESGKMFSGSCEQKSPATVHSLLRLPRPSLSPVSLLKGQLDENVMCVSSALSRSHPNLHPPLPIPFPNPYSVQL